MICMRLVRVSWFDITEHETGWHEQEAIDDLKLFEVESYGYLIKDHGQSITLSADFIQSSKTYGRLQTIPKGCIKNITTLEIGKDIDFEFPVEPLC